MPSLSSIRTGYGGNIGGVKYFRLAPKDWIQHDFIVDKVFGQVTVQVNLIPGRFWLSGLCIEDSMGFSEESKPVAGGSLVKAELSGVVLKDSMNTNINITELRYFEFVIVIVDRNKVARIVGNKLQGMKLSTAYDSGKKHGDATLYSVSFNQEYQDHAPIYGPSSGGSVVLGNNGGLSTTTGFGFPIIL